MNRLSPPDNSVPQDLGYTPVVDKQLMANFPAPDMSWINKLKVGEPLSNSKESFLQEIIPKQTHVVKETTPKQTYIVKEIITKQTVVEAAPNQSVAKAATPKQTIVKTVTPKQTVVKTAASKQTVAKAATPKQTITKTALPKQPVAKTAKPDSTVKPADILLIPPPPPLVEDNNQPNPSTVGRVQKPAKTENPAPPMPSTAERSQTRSAAADKPVQKKTPPSPMNRPATGDQVSIKQPAGLLNVAERSEITNFYADYSLPVLTTPAAALLIDRNYNTIQASFDQPLEPESGRNIIGQ